MEELVEDFDIVTYVFNTLKTLEIPVYFVSRNEVSPPLVIFNIHSERGYEFWDDKEQVVKYQVSVNIFTKGNFLKFKKQIINLMEAKGFIKHNIPSCIYQADVGIYNQPMVFTFYK